jgi:hypothetical protein
VKHPYVFSDEKLVGQYCAEAGEIRIKERTLAGEIQSDMSQLVSFFHEILHGVNDIYCMGNIGRECDTEQLINAISEGLVQVLIDNNMQKLLWGGE